MIIQEMLPWIQANHSAEGIEIKYVCECVCVN